MARSDAAAPRRRKAVDHRTLVAFHEAGHAVLSAAINDTPEHVTIRADGNVLGFSRQKHLTRPTVLVQVHVAGFAAEHLLTGRRSKAFDREVGFALIGRIDETLADAFEACRGTDGWRAVQEVLRIGVRDTDNDIKVEVEKFYDIAKESLSVIWPAVKAVAEALLERDELDRDAFDEVIEGHGIYLPVFEVQKRHGLLRAGAPTKSVASG